MNIVLSLLIGGPSILWGIAYEYVIRGVLVGRYTATRWMDGDE